MFRAPIREGLCLELLEERHAPEVFSLVDRDRDRDYLRQWLPWVDATKTADETLRFIKSSLEQFASGRGCCVRAKLVTGLANRSKGRASCRLPVAP